MKLLVSFVIQGENQYRFDDEIVEVSLTAPLYSPEPRQPDIEAELVKWAQKKQSGLNMLEKIVVINTLRI